MNQVFIIGWGRAAFDQIHSWATKGHLPVLARLLETGCHGPLHAIGPPRTAPIWSSFLTGKNPGKHGIFDDMCRRSGTYERECVTSRQRQAPTFWRLLSRGGCRVLSVCVPTTYPPEPVNGILMSDLDAPGQANAESDVTAHCIYPPHSWTELRPLLVGRPSICTATHAVADDDEPTLGLEQLLHRVRYKADIMKHLLRSKPWDCAMMVFNETDLPEHWHGEPKDPPLQLQTMHPTAWHDRLLPIYQELDCQTGAFLELLPPEAILVLLSLRGNGGGGQWIIYPNRWLSERDMLTFGDRSVAPTCSAPIDWGRTEAFFEEESSYPALWINRQGREPQGIVAPGIPYERLRDRLIQELQAWRHPETGMPLVAQALRREEVYHGPYLDNAPDIVVRWAVHHVGGYVFGRSTSARGSHWSEKIDWNLSVQRSGLRRPSGPCWDRGILLAKGPGIKRAHGIADARIVDLAPTILHWLRQPIPDDMDGRVLRDLWKDGGHETGRDQAIDNTKAAKTLDSSYTPEDEQIIMERLKSLGYLE